MGVKIWINKNHIYLSLCYNKKRWRESTGLTVSTDRAQNKEAMKVAEKLRSMREIQIVSGANGITDGETRRVTLLEYTENIAKSKQDKKAIPYLEKYGGGQIRLCDVSPEWYDDFQNKMKNDPVIRSAYTQDKYCSVVRSALKKAVQERILLECPCDHVRRIKTHDSLRAFLTPDEIKRMRNTPCPGKFGEETKAAFLVGVYTGLRVSDLKSLEWSEIDRGQMQIIKRMKKTREYIYIPITQDVLDLVDTMEKTSEYVFPRLASMNDMSTTGRELCQWAEASNVQKHVTWHVARHTNATNLLESGADLYTVQKLLGHSNISTTAKYTKVTDGRKRSAVARLTERYDEQ